MIGSLFTGYGGLDMAVEMTVGGDVAWVCDNNPGAAKILTHRYPDIPNLGDVTAVNWATVQPVDVLTAGFPCQPVSHAGKRKGTDDERWLFDEVCRALRDLDPPPGLCLFENVAGLLSANRGDAMARVVGGLAESGYVGRWWTVRASDVGAPHRRERVFIVAWPTENADLATSDQRRLAVGGHDAPLSGATPADPGGQRHGGGQDSRSVGRLDSDHEGETRERERSRPVVGDRSDAAAADAGEFGRNRGEGVVGDGRGQAIRREASDHVSDSGVSWGDYAPAIHRWEHILRRSAPAPTEPGRTGQPRLSPAFVEWMMGLPAGWVTDVPGLTRNEQLKALGNGVVPQQAATALALLLTEQVAA